LVELFGDGASQSLAAHAGNVVVDDAILKLPATEDQDRRLRVEALDVSTPTFEDSGAIVRCTHWTCDRL
jgi:hypothetical protein